MDYKETLNLPKTDFPMRADLPRKEKEILKIWEEMDLYEKIKEKTRQRPMFILHDGPPYANGNIHQGHALNKILKDIIVKAKIMDGYRCDFIPGWDCHGLPIEHQVDKMLGKKKEGLTKSQVRKLCRDYALKFIDIQREEFKRLGVLGDWKNPYFTMHPHYQATIIREFSRFLLNGYTYRGKKPIHWCWSCLTALAEAEVEYEDKTSPSIYVKFPLAEDAISVLPGVKPREASIIIWTTTPWTLPANLAIALHPSHPYAVVETEKGIFIIAKALVEEVMSKLQMRDFNIITTFPSTILEQKNAIHPIYGRNSLIVLADYVSMDTGTGCVHTAPGHGQEDYNTGIQYNLDIYSPVDDRGRFTEDVKYFGGMFVFDANPSINDFLRKNGSLLHEETIVHSYPHCWRCKNPVIFRSTEQWFISMEKNKLRENCLRWIDNVRWIPYWGRDRIYNMIASRPDWCISRQRSWGIPITVFYCTSCGEMLFNEDILNHIISLVENHGADIWFEKDADEILPEGVRCKKCGNDKFRKDENIIDVWFDSGVSWAAVLEKREELGFPADMYLEGSDQHRGWFHSSLIAAVATRGCAPYRSVLTHGFVVDGEGRKMSKSLGNVIHPQEVIDRYGAEILRLWVAAEDYRNDVTLSMEILERLAEAYRRIRNTLRFILGNLYDFDPESQFVDLKKREEIDRWITSRLQHIIKKCINAYRNYEFHIIYHTIHNFCTVDLSSLYFDIIKDRLYCSRADSSERKSCQSALYEIGLAIIKLIAPILSFTADEVSKYMPYSLKLGESVFLNSFPSIEEGSIDYELEKKWEVLLKIRREILRALEILRKQKLIGSSLDALVEILSPQDIREFVSENLETLRMICIVSQMEIIERDKGGGMEGEEIKDMKIWVSRARGSKCERCWTYSTETGMDPSHPGICPRCLEVLS